MNARTLFPEPTAVATAATNHDILRRLADRRLPAPETIQALADELGHPDRSNFVKRLKQLERDGLVVRDAEDAPTGLKLTAAGERAALAVAAATGAEDLDADARLIPHARIRLNPLNPRKKIDAQELADFADNIEAKGVLQPVIVYPADAEGQHVLYAGERRWRAVELLITAGRLPADFRMPARVREPDEMEDAVQTASIAVSENGQRANLTIQEELKAWQIILAGWKGSIADCARAHGRDVRTVQEFAKVLKEAAVDALEAFFAYDPDWKWEQLRDSVKRLSLEPAQALAVIELAHRQQHEDPAQTDDAGGPPWVAISLVPTRGYADLVDRGLLEFKILDGDPVARVRTDNAQLDRLLREAHFYEARLECLYVARAAVVGSFEARTLEQTGELATEWARFPEIEPVREEDDYFTGTDAQLADKLQAETDPAAEGSQASRPHEDAPQAQSNHQAHEEHQGDPEAKADLRDCWGPGLAPEPRQPTPDQLLALAEIAHKTAFNPVRVTPAIGEPVDAAEVDTIARPDVGTLEQVGWIDTFGGDLVEAKSQFAVRLSDEGASVLERHGADFADIRPMVDQARKDAGLSLARRAELAQSRGYATAFLNTDTPARPALTPDLPTLKPAAALALVELAARIAREGVEISGKPWRMVEVWDYHRDAAASEITHARLAGWASHKAAWYGYITDRGHAFLRAKGVDPDMISEADLASYREIAGVARQEAGWSTPFLNPKTTPDTGPARTAGVSPVSPTASAARAPTALAGAVEILTSLADEAEWASQELAAISATIASKDAEKSYALIQRIDAVQAEVAKGRHFVQVARAGAAA